MPFIYYLYVEFYFQTSPKLAVMSDVQMVQQWHIYSWIHLSHKGISTGVSHCPGFH